MRRFYKVVYYSEDGKENIALFTSKNAASEFFDQISWKGIRAIFEDMSILRLDI